MASSQHVLMRLEGITKAYPGLLANDDVTLDLHAGEVHALLGENGAGKTTLMGVLFGLLRPDSGRILLNGREVAIHEPRDAMALGIGYVQQHFSLIPVLSVAENIVLALRTGKHRISVTDGQAKVQALSKKYRLAVHPTAPVERLSVGEQQRAELLKALAGDPRILILDEPSSLLSPQEAEHLQTVLRQLAADGVSIILISHKLDEVLSVADRVTVLRRGRKVQTLEAKDATKAGLGALMVGDLRSVDGEAREFGGVGEVVIAGRGIVAHGDRGERVLNGADIEIRAGEILGIAGLEGSGQVQLIEVIAGVRRATAGLVECRGRDIGSLTIAQRQVLGIAHIPADRRRDGLVATMSVADNLALPVASQPGVSRFGVLRPKAIRRHAEQMIRRFDIRVPGPDVLISALSGGNQQKVVLARELSRDPSVVLCCYPTWGLDFAAAQSVHDELRRYRDRGAAVAVASVDLDELLEVSDRIVVMQGGRVTGELKAVEATPERIGLLMGGVA